MKLIAFALFASAAIGQTDPNIILRGTNISEEIAKARQADLQAQQMQQQIEINRLRLQQMQKSVPRNGWYRQSGCEYLFAGTTKSVARVCSSKNTHLWSYQLAGVNNKPVLAGTKKQAKLAVQAHWSE